MFKRRGTHGWFEQFKAVVYPRKGWTRPYFYYGYRVRRLPDSAHRVALGFACGIAASFTPFFGLHFVYAALIALFIGGNFLSAILGTFVGNPITFPFIATSSYTLGRRLLGYGADGADEATLFQLFKNGVGGLGEKLGALVGLGEAKGHDLAEFVAQVIIPYYLGGLVLGTLFAAAGYLFSRPLIAAYQKRRRKRIAKRIAKRQEKRDAGAS